MLIRKRLKSRDGRPAPARNPPRGKGIPVKKLPCPSLLERRKIYEMCQNVSHPSPSPPLPIMALFFLTLFYPRFSFEIKFFIQDHDSSSADFSSSTKLPVLLTKSRTTLISLQKCVCIFVNFSLIICTRQFSALFSNKCIRKANNVRNGFYTWSQWKMSK